MSLDIYSDIMLLKRFTAKMRLWLSAFMAALTPLLANARICVQKAVPTRIAQSTYRHHTFEWTLSSLNRFCAGGSSAGWPTTTNASGTTPSGSWQCLVNPATCPSIG